MRPARVLAYVRVSSDTQERSGTSLAGQREEIARHCASVGWPEARFYVETESAGEEKLTRRVQLRSLIDEAQSGDAVVVAKQDRWSRDTVFFLQSVRELVRRGVRFLSLAERFDPDTPEGRFAATVMAGVAEQERDRIRARTVGRRQALRDQGCWTEGVSPFGYVRDPATRRLVVQQAEAVLVGEAFARCVGGESIGTIADSFRDRQIGRTGGPPIRWDKKAIHSMLRARWHLGEIRHVDGTWHPAHEPVIPRDVFEEAQRAMHERRKGGRSPAAESRTASWLLRGVAVCGSCGRRVGAAYGPSEYASTYYVCNGRLRNGECDEPYARVDTTDADAGRLVVLRLEELRHLLAGARSGETEPDEERVGALRGSLEAAKLRRARVVSLAVDGVIGREELQARIGKIDEETARIETSLAAEARRTRLQDPTVRAETLASVERLRRAWGGLKAPARRAILVRLAEKIELQDGRTRMTWKSVETMSQATVAGNLFPPTDAKSTGTGGRSR
jgi:site-specific DNA recombinase